MLSRRQDLVLGFVYTQVSSPLVRLTNIEITDILSVSKKSAYGVLIRILTLPLSRLCKAPGGKQRKETLLGKLANPPHMSPDSDVLWRAAALQSTQRVFAVCEQL